MARVPISQAGLYTPNTVNDQLKFNWLKFEVDESKSIGGKKVYKPVRVRFLYDKGEDFEAFVVHNLKEELKSFKEKQYIDCLDELDVHDCPLCKANFTKKLIYYIPMFNVDTKQVVIWERGSGLQETLKGISEKHQEKGWGLVGSIYEIRRVGEGLDTQYMFDRDEHDGTTIADLVDADGAKVERPEVFGRLILSRPKADMEVFLATGELPKKGGEDKSTNTVAEQSIRPRVSGNDENLIDADQEIPF